MLIVFDMDNTLTDEVGFAVRPGITGLLEKLLAQGHKLALWTNSCRNRARTILAEHRLNRYFSIFVFREDYDPQNMGKPKDIRKINGDFLVDDDPREIQYVKSIKKRGYQIKAYRKGCKLPQTELDEILRIINKRKLFLKAI